VGLVDLPPLLGMMLAGILLKHFGVYTISQSHSPFDSHPFDGYKEALLDLR